jgi:hypothetical protein
MGHIMKVYEFIATAKWGILAAGFWFLAAAGYTFVEAFDS